MRFRCFLLVAALLAPALANAQEMAKPEPVCAAKDADLPAHLAPWTQRGAIDAAATPAGLGGPATLNLSHAYLANLPDSAAVTYAAPPEKAPAAGSHAGLLVFNAQTAGTYVVALGAGAWIDVVGPDGKAIRSAGHGHGPACSTIRKMVEFPLSPGRHVVQLSNAPAEAVIMVFRKP